MTARIYVTGFVQHVGFRQFVKSKANKLNIKGWVKNLPDGRVEAIIQGDKKNVENLVEMCWKGPFLAHVKDIVIKEEENGNFEFFEILH